MIRLEFSAQLIVKRYFPAFQLEIRAQCRRWKAPASCNCRATTTTRFYASASRSSTLAREAIRTTSSRRPNARIFVLVGVRTCAKVYNTLFSPRQSLFQWSAADSAFGWHASFVHGGTKKRLFAGLLVSRRRDGAHNVVLSWL